MKIKNKLKTWLFQFTYPQVLHPTYVWRLKNKSKTSMLLMGFLPISRFSLISQSFREKYWESINNVGTMDEPFVYLNWDVPINSKILDFGCGGSSISLGLSSFGYQVTGIDFRYAGYSHKNFTYLKKDFLKFDFDSNSFDCVIAISVLEHVGMGHYGDEFVENADKKSMEKIYDILKPNGVVFISVPGGKRKIYEKDRIKYIRIFDSDAIEKLCEKFTIEKEFFYKKEDQEWMPTTRDELSKIEYINEDVGVILIKARKK